VYKRLSRSETRPSSILLLSAQNPTTSLKNKVTAFNFSGCTCEENISFQVRADKKFRTGHGK
jgi:hypothetical protein